MKRFFLLSIWLFTISVCAQNKPNAILFDTFEDNNGKNVKLLDEKIDRFARRLNDETESTKGYIVEYVESTVNTVKELNKSRSNSCIKQVKDNINRIYQFPDYRINFEFGGISRDSKGNMNKFAKVEFWLIPQGADLPKNRAEDDADWFMACECPTISLDGNKNIYDTKETLNFSAELAGGDNDEVTFNWSISDGKIIGGQGTKDIKIDLKNAKSDKIKIRVEIKALCYSCPSEVEELIIIH